MSSSPVAADTNRKWLGLGLALLGAALFATKGIFIKLALAEGIDTLTSLTWRMLVAVPVFATTGVLAFRRRAKRLPGERLLDGRALLQAGGVGLVGYYLASYLDFSALGYISAQLDRLILLTYPFFVVLFGAAFFKREVTPMMIVSLLVSYAGIALILVSDFAAEGDDVVLGSLLVAGSAIAYAAYQIMAKPLIDRLGAPLFTSLAMSAAGIAVVLHFFLVNGPAGLAIDGYGLLLMLAIGIVSTVLPAYCISGAIGMLGSERTAMTGNISPVVTVALAVWVLGENFTLWHAIGTALVLGGVWLFGQKRRPKRAEIAATEVEP